eukprot:scaffold40339_cov68-Phaeocystis_antarctica.AAC.1
MLPFRSVPGACVRLPKRHARTAYGDPECLNVGRLWVICMCAWTSPHAARLLPGRQAVLAPCDILLRLRQWEPDCVRSPSAGRQLRLRRARFDSHRYQVDGHLRPRVEGAG